MSGLITEFSELTESSISVNLSYRDNIESDSSSLSSEEDLPIMGSQYENHRTIADMPMRGTKEAPRTFKGKYTEVENFINHYERLLLKNQVISNKDRCEYITEYCSTNVSHFIRGSSHYNNPNWHALKTELLKYYDADRAKQRYRPSDMLACVKEARETACYSLSQWKKYYIKYNSIAGFLLSKRKLTELEYAAYFWHGIPKELQQILENKLQAADPNRDMSEPYDMARVCAAAETYFQRDKFPLMLFNAEELGIEIAEDSSDEDSDDPDSSDDEYSQWRKKKKKKYYHKKSSRDSSDSKKSSSKSNTFNGPKEEVEGLIKQLNSMSIDDQNYGHTYYKAISLDQNAGRCINQEPRVMSTLPCLSTPPVNNVPYVSRSNLATQPPRGDRGCFGCNEQGHMMSNCPHMTELLKSGIVRHESPDSRRFVMKDGSRIFRMKGESLAQAAERNAPPKSHFMTLHQNVGNFYSKTSTNSNGYISDWEEQDFSEDDDSEDFSEDDFSIYAVARNDSDTDDEYPPQLVRVMPADRTLKKSTAARKEIFDGVHVPPASRFNRGKRNENYKPRFPAQVESARPATRFPNKSEPLKDKNIVNIPETASIMPDMESVPDPIPIDARKARFDNDKLDDIIIKSPGTENKPRPTPRNNDVMVPKSRHPEVAKPREKPRLDPVNPNQDAAQKGKNTGRQSELSSQTESHEVVNKILDVAVSMPLRDILGTSKELCSGIQDMIRIKNSKIATTALSRKEPIVASSLVDENQGLLIQITVECEGTPMDAIIDTGSQVNIVREDIAQQFIRKPIDLSKRITMNDANGGLGHLKGLISNVSFACGGVHTRTGLYVGENVPFQLLLGRPWQRKNFVSIDERSDGTYLLFKDPQGLKTRFELLVTPESKPPNWHIKNNQFNTYTVVSTDEPARGTRDSIKDSLSEIDEKHADDRKRKEGSAEARSPKVMPDQRQSQTDPLAADLDKITLSYQDLTASGSIVSHLVAFPLVALLLFTILSFRVLGWGIRRATEISQLWGKFYLSAATFERTLQSHHTPNVHLPIIMTSYGANRNLSPPFVLSRTQVHTPGAPDWRADNLSPYESVLHDVLIQRDRFYRGEPLNIRPIFVISSQGAYVRPYNPNNSYQECVLLNAGLMIHNPETNTPSMQNGHAVIHFFSAPELSPVPWHLEAPLITQDDLCAHMNGHLPMPPAPPGTSIPEPPTAVDPLVKAATQPFDSSSLPTPEDTPSPQNLSEESHKATIDRVTPIDQIVPKYVMTSRYKRKRCNLTETNSSESIGSEDSFHTCGSCGFSPHEARPCGAAQFTSEAEYAELVSDSDEFSDCPSSPRPGWAPSYFTNEWPSSSDESDSDSSPEISPYDRPFTIPRSSLYERFPRSVSDTTNSPPSTSESDDHTNENSPRTSTNDTSASENDFEDDEEMPPLMSVSPDSSDSDEPLSPLNLAFPLPRFSVNRAKEILKENPFTRFSSPEMLTEETPSRDRQDQYVQQPFVEANIIAYQELLRDLSATANDPINEFPLTRPSSPTLPPPDYSTDDYYPSSPGRDAIANWSFSNASDPFALQYRLDIDEFGSQAFSQEPLSSHPDAPYSPGASFMLANNQQQERLIKRFGRWAERSTILAQIRGAIVRGIRRLKNITFVRNWEHEITPVRLTHKHSRIFLC